MAGKYRKSITFPLIFQIFHKVFHCLVLIIELFYSRSQPFLGVVASDSCSRSPLINNKFQLLSEKLSGIHEAKMNHSYFLASHKVYTTYTSSRVASVNLGKPFGTLPPNILRVKEDVLLPLGLFNLLKRKRVVFDAGTNDIQDTAGFKIF